MEIKTLGDFVSLVKKTREAQKAYFRTKSPAALMESKTLEAHLDAVIEEREQRLAREKQANLFD